MSQIGATQGSKTEIIRQARANGAVATPGGFRRRDHVHVLGRGQAILKNNVNSVVLNMETAGVVVDPGQAVALANPADQTGGWMAWASWRNGTGSPISSLTSAWTVPADPQTDSGQLVYLFNGLQDPAGTQILQPVLQWGVSGAGGGSYWSVASWHVDSNNQAYCTPAVRVATGDRLVGVMTLQAKFANGSCNYSCSFQGIANKTLLALGIAELTDAEETLEAYGITARTDHPNAADIVFGQIGIAVNAGNPSAAWATATTQNPAYGESCDIQSSTNPNGEIRVVF